MERQVITVSRHHKGFVTPRYEERNAKGNFISNKKASSQGAAVGARSRRRGILHQDLYRLRMLCNRSAHHEPIFDRDLAIDQEKICGTIGYVESEAKTGVMNNSRIVEILAMKEQHLNGQLRSSV